jgi:MoaA/NifB/PqqE/SkfB family radical SAM enzyme
MKVLEKLGIQKDIHYLHDQAYELKDKTYLRWDFRIPADEPIFIEYDGIAHFLPTRFGGVSKEKAHENLIKSQHRDKLKDDYCDDNGYALLRIPYWEKKNIEKLVTEFLNDYIMISQP